jgi:hypothetical protein
VHFSDIACAPPKAGTTRLGDVVLLRNDLLERTVTEGFLKVRGLWERIADPSPGSHYTENLTDTVRF